MTWADPKRAGATRPHARVPTPGRLEVAWRQEAPRRGGGVLGWKVCDAASEKRRGVRAGESASLFGSIEQTFVHDRPDFTDGDVKTRNGAAQRPILTSVADAPPSGRVGRARDARHDDPGGRRMPAVAFISHPGDGDGGWWWRRCLSICDADKHPRASRGRSKQAHAMAPAGGSRTQRG